MAPTAHQRRPPSSPTAAAAAARGPRRGFTLTEILVVIGIIVLLLTLSLPAITYITGSRSVDGASNVIASTLAVARNYALSEQHPCGVLFYIEPSTGAVSMAIVHDISATVALPAGYDVMLDRIPDVGTVALPKGVRAQGLINPPQFIGSVMQPRATDGYVGYNRYTLSAIGNASYTVDSSAATTNTYPYGPVVLFDGQGKLVALRYAFAGAVPAPTAPGNFLPSELAYTLYAGTGPTGSQIDRTKVLTPAARATMPRDILPTAPASTAVTSVIALAVYDEHEFADQGYSDTDWVVDQGASPQTPHSGSFFDSTNNASNERAEETWLDAHATPLLFNRYNGTLYRSE